MKWSLSVHLLYPDSDQLEPSIDYNTANSTRLTHIRVSYRIFSLGGGGGGGGGDVVCGLTGMGEYFSQVMPEMVLKALWFHFADK